MVLRGKLQDNPGEPICLCEYPPYKIKNADGKMVKNPAANEATYLILDLKMGDAAQQEAAIKRIFKAIDANLEKDIVIAVVPSHDPNKVDSGIRKLALKLAGAGRIDGTGCLVRHTKVAKKTGGGSRDISIDLNSIRVEKQEILTGHAVLLLDDVATSGNSLAACKQLLENAGAKYVQCVAIGKTVH